MKGEMKTWGKFWGMECIGVATYYGSKRFPKYNRLFLPLDDSQKLKV